MSKATHYTPPLTRLNVCALYHEAKARKIPMTQLANDLVEAALRESVGWQKAQAQQIAMPVGGGGQGIPDKTNHVTTTENPHHRDSIFTD